MQQHLIGNLRQKLRAIILYFRTAVWFKNPVNIDLGKWFNSEHVISEPLKPEHFEKYADLPPGEYLDQPEA